MRIQIDGAKLTPSWETLQSAINEATKNESGRLIRINRTDRGCDYRAPGVYRLEFATDADDIIDVELTVNP